MDRRTGHWQIGLFKFCTAQVRLSIPNELSAQPGDIDQEVVIEVVNLEHLCAA